MAKFERKSPKVSIVIPSWFTPDQHGKYGEHETFWFAQECLCRVFRNTPRGDFELIVVDNGSSLCSVDIDQSIGSGKYAGMAGLGDDRPHDWVKSYFRKADVLIRNGENLGFGPACNQGFALARGEYVVCMNNDVLVWPGWLDALIEPFSLDLDVPAGVVMPALARDTRDARRALEMPEVDLSLNTESLGKGAEFGSLWAAERSLLKRIADTRDGYEVFDEDFRLGMGEDRWLWQQVRHLGRETYRTHRTRVFHQGNMSIGKFRNRREYTEDNRRKLAEKIEEAGGRAVPEERCE